MSGQFVDNGYATFIAGAALSRGERVKLNSSGQVIQAVAGSASEFSIGVTEEDRSSGDAINIRLWSAEGTFRCTASAAIAAGALVYGSAAGRIATTVAGNPLGYAKEAASGAASIIEVVLLRG